jgi:hypothetical protein
MRSRFQEIVLCTALGLFGVGCQTAEEHRRPSQDGVKEQPFGGLSFAYPPFQELKDLWRALSEPFEEGGYMHVFEKDGVEVAICMQPWRSDGDNTLVIYTYDGVGRQWCPRALWDTRNRGSNEVIGVGVNFYKRSGTIEAYSSGGRNIFRADIASLAVKQQESRVSSRPNAEYPAPRTLEELRALVVLGGEGGSLQVFEKGPVKVGVRAQSWCAAGWKRIILYTFDEKGTFWSPRAVWDTGTKDVRVSFDKWSGIIKVRSGGGRSIFQANILALKVGQASWAW